MNNSSITGDLITPKELSKLLKKSPASIYRLVDSKLFPFYKIGGSLRFSKDDINEYLNQSRVEPRSQ